MQKATSPTRVAANSRPRRASLIPLADSYLFWSVVGATLRGLGWFAGLFLAFAVVTSAQRVVQKNIPTSIALEAIALQMPRLVLFTIPASLLFGVVSTFTEMSSKGEITAFMVGGMSLKRMLRGPLLLALALALFAFWLQEVIVPGAELRKGNLWARAGNSIKIDDGFNYIKKRPNKTVESIWQAESFDASNKLLVKPVVQFFREDNTVSREIKAEIAQWDPQTKMWVLKKVHTRVNPIQNGNISKENSVVAESDEARIQTSESPAPDSFSTSVLTTRDQIEKANYEMVSWQQLMAYRSEKLAEYPNQTGKDQKETLKDIRAITYGIHDKWATPLVVIAMVLFGAPLGVRPQRTASAGLAMGLSLMVIMGYYLTWTMCTQVGKGGTPFPEFLAYLPFGIMATFGTILVARKS